MKYKFLFFLGLGLFITAGISAQKGTPNKGFELTVKMNNYSDTLPMYLGRYYGSSQYLTDTAKYDAKRKAYVFKNTELKEPGMYLLLSSDKRFAEIIIDKNQQFGIETNYPDLGASIRYSNSPDNEEYRAFAKSTNPLYAHIDSLQKARETATSDAEKEKLLKEIQNSYKKITDSREQFGKEHPENLMTAIFKAQQEAEIPEAPASVPDSLHNIWKYNYYKNHYWDNVNPCDNRLIYTPMYHQLLEKYMDKVLPPQPDSVKIGLANWIDKTECGPELFKYSVWHTVDKYQKSNVIGYDAIWVYLAKRYYLTGKAFWASPSIVENFEKRISRVEPLLIGNRPPEFYCPDTSVDTPKEQYVSVFSPKNKYTIIIFWEPNCGHCKKQMPLLAEFYRNKHKELDFEVIAICKDFNVDAWKKYLHDNNIPNWINLNGKASNIDYNDLWDIYSTPTIYVLDREKRIITKRINADQIEPFIRNWQIIHYPNEK